MGENGLNRVGVSLRSGLAFSANSDNIEKMPRWEGPPKYVYSPQRLAFFREANRRYRERLRGGAPPMPHVERGRVGNAVMRANQRKKKGLNA
jgi:hypothetical protein